MSEIVAAHLLAQVVHSCSLSFSFGENAVVFNAWLMGMSESVFFFHFYRHARQLSAHTRALTHVHAEISRTPLSCGGGEWRWFALAPHAIIHTNMTCIIVCVCVCMYVCFLFVMFLVCLLFLVHLTAVCIFLYCPSMQEAFFVQE